MRKFFVGRFKSLGYALKGFFLLATTEDSIIAQTSGFLIVAIFGFVLGISPQDWIHLILGMGLVLSTEGMNTAVEKMADFVHKEHHPKIGFIKDISAGAVTFAMFTFIAILVITFLPYIF